MKHLNCFLNTFSLTPSRFIFQQKPEKPSEKEVEKKGPVVEKPNEPNTPKKGQKTVDKAAEALKRAEFQQFKAKIEETNRKIRELPKNASLEEYTKVDNSVEIMFQITERLGINFKDRFLQIAKAEGLAVGGGNWDLKIDGDNIVITRTVDFFTQRPLATSTGRPLPLSLSETPPLTIKFDLTVRPDLTFSTGESWTRNRVPSSEI